ncbi:hypothetical protein KKA14_19695 [bacterium]|nr:hypothetical protein [bacterium]
MRKTLLFLVSFLIIVIPVSVFSIEYLWTDDQGNRYFECGGFVVGGEAVIKEQGPGLFRARGVLVDRQIRARSIYHAAQVACGESKEPKEEKPVADANANEK